MKPLALFVLLAAAAAGAPAPAAPVPAPPPGGELLVMNDGLKPVTGVRLRPAGRADAAWSGDVLKGEAIPVNEGRRLDIAPLKLGCQVEVELTVQGQAGPVLGEQAVCEDPRFWVGFALGLDEPGMGVGGFAVRAEETPGAEAPSKPVAVRPRIDLNRGLPVCPGDPRCRKKK